MVKGMIIVLVLSVLLSSVSVADVVYVDNDWVSYDFIRESCKKNIVTTHASITGFALDTLEVANDEFAIVVLNDCTIKRIVHSGKGKLHLISNGKTRIDEAVLDNENLIENAKCIKRITVTSDGTVIDDEYALITFTKKAKYVTFMESSYTDVSDDVSLTLKVASISDVHVEDNDVEHLSLSVSADNVSCSTGEILLSLSVNADCTLQGVIQAKDGSTTDVVSANLYCGENEAVLRGLLPGKTYSFVGRVELEGYESDIITMEVDAKDYYLGEGSDENPYRVYRVDELLNIGALWSLEASYILMKDIDLTKIEDYKDHGLITNFTPIGSSTNPFKGTFNGQGYSIKNVDINTEGMDNVALFAYSHQATIKNLCLSNVDVRGNDNVGALVGTSFNSQISNIGVSGEVNGRNHVGGLVGKSIQNSSFTNIVSTVTVRGYDLVGGLCGVGEITSNFTTLFSSLYIENNGAGIINDCQGLIVHSIVDSHFEASNISRIASLNAITPFLMSNYAVDDHAMPEGWVGVKGPFMPDGQDISRDALKNESSVCYMGWDMNDDYNGDGGYFVLHADHLELWFVDGEVRRKIMSVSLD